MTGVIVIETDVPSGSIEIDETGMAGVKLELVSGVRPGYRYAV